MHRKITAEEALIRTATVEIKAITISGKQMTLAVFRQLEEESIIDFDSGMLVGVPWGRVNYCGKDCPDREHVHVLWQKGNELRRCIIEHRCEDNYALREMKNELSRHEAGLVQRMVLDGVDTVRWQGNGMTYDYECPEVRVDGSVSEGQLPHGVTFHVDYYGRKDGQVVSIQSEPRPGVPWPWRKLDSGPRLVDRVRGRNAPDIQVSAAPADDGVEHWVHDRGEHHLCIAVKWDQDREQVIFRYPASLPDELKQFIAESMATHRDAIKAHFTFAEGDTTKSRIELQRILDDYRKPNDFVGLMRSVLRTKSSITQYRKQWLQSWEQIAATDQLFIAV